jgi:hypothetical protein
MLFAYFASIYIAEDMKELSFKNNIPLELVTNSLTIYVVTYTSKYESNFLSVEAILKGNNLAIETKIYQFLIFLIYLSKL